MPRNAKVFLADIQSAAEYLLRRTRNLTLEDYLGDRDLQFIVERNFILIGEAMVNLRRDFPNICEILDKQGPIIAFRNFIIHRYWAIDNEQIWSVVVTRVAPLQAAVTKLLQELDTE